MPCGPYTVTDVPDASLSGALAILQLDHPITVQTQKQPNGKWTIVATFPPCPPAANAMAPQIHFDALKQHVSLDRLKA